MKWKSIGSGTTYPLSETTRTIQACAHKTPPTVVHHVLQDWGLICFKMIEYWSKCIVQRLLGIIGDLALFLINRFKSVRECV